MPHPNPTVVEWILNEIESDLKKAGLWSEQPIDPAVIRSSQAAFCMDVMPFNSWIQFVLLPRARNILATNGNWPSNSMVAAQAVREFDGIEVGELIDHLAKFDALFTEPLDAYGFPAWMRQPQG